MNQCTDDSMNQSPPDPRSDQQLVAALNGGDASAFDAIYFRYREWVARLAQRFVGNDNDALDVLQETFLYLHRKFPGSVLSARLTTFLYPVVKHLALANRRSRGKFGGEWGALGILGAPATKSAGEGDEGCGAVVCELA